LELLPGKVEALGVLGILLLEGFVFLHGDAGGQQREGR
jgi:hypothetical protein